MATCLFCHERCQRNFTFLQVKTDARSWSNEFNRKRRARSQMHAVEKDTPSWSVMSSGKSVFMVRHAKWKKIVARSDTCSRESQRRLRDQSCLMSGKSVLMVRHAKWKKMIAPLWSDMFSGNRQTRVRNQTRKVRKDSRAFVIRRTCSKKSQRRFRGQTYPVKKMFSWSEMRSGKRQ